MRGWRSIRKAVRGLGYMGKSTGQTLGLGVLIMGCCMFPPRAILGGGLYVR